MKRTITTVCCLLVFFNSLTAQEVLHLGNFRSSSTLGPLHKYWNHTPTVYQFQRDLDSLLQKKYGMKLSMEQAIQFKETTASASKTQKYPAISVDIIEYDPQTLQKMVNLNSVSDVLYFKTILSSLAVKVMITNENGAAVFSKELEVYIRKGNGNGIGLPISNLHLTAKGLLDVLKNAFSLLLNKQDSTEVIEINTPGAYAEDNYVLPKITGQTKSIISVEKDIARFNWYGEQQILRWNKQLFREIVLSGSRKTSLNDSLSKTIKKITKEGSVFLYLVQDLRDAINDKTYRIEMPAQMTASEFVGVEQLPRVETIAGYHHRLIDGLDTIGFFSIKTNLPDSTKLFNFNKATNGVDSSSTVPLFSAKNKTPVVYQFKVEGAVKGTPFAILISGNKFIRELYWNKELVGIVQGESAPERFVCLSTSIEVETWNLLLLLAFNSFFQ